MPTSKKYFQDRLVLLLISISVFLVVMGSILILLRLDSGRSDGYIVQYRPNLGISAYKAGNISTFFNFIGFMVIVLVMHLVLSMKAYRLRRQISLAILALGVLLLVLSVVVSNALLILR